MVFLVSPEASGQNFSEEEEGKGEVSRKREREANNDDSSLKEDQVNMIRTHIKKFTCVGEVLLKKLLHILRLCR